MRGVSAPRAAPASLLRRAGSHYESVRLNLRGLDPEARYAIANLDTGARVAVTRRELAEKDVLVQIAVRPGTALIVCERVPAPESPR